MKFRFETLLKIRKNREDVLVRELGMIENHLQNQKKRLQFMQDIAEDRKKEMTRIMDQPLNIDKLVLYDNFFSGVSNEEKRQNQVIGEIEEKFQKKRAEVIEAMRKRRTLEILKEKDAGKQRKAQQKKEIEIQDETGANIWRLQS